jgi:hypothetical protein
MIEGSGSGRPKTCGSGSGTLLLKIIFYTDVPFGPEII